MWTLRTSTQAACCHAMPPSTPWCPQSRNSLDNRVHVTRVDHPARLWPPSRSSCPPQGSSTAHRDGFFRSFVLANENVVKFPTEAMSSHVTDEKELKKLKVGTVNYGML